MLSRLPAQLVYDTRTEIVATTSVIRTELNLFFARQNFTRVFDITFNIITVRKRDVQKRDRSFSADGQLVTADSSHGLCFAKVN